MISNINEKEEKSTIVVVPHIWNEKNECNKLESSIDVLQFGSDLGQYELCNFLSQCKKEPLKSLVCEEMKRRISEEVIGLDGLLSSVLIHGKSVPDLCECIKEKTGDDTCYKYYKAIKEAQRSLKK